MSGRELFYIFQNIDEKYVQQAAEYEKPRVHRLGAKGIIVLIAAAVVILSLTATAIAGVQWNRLLQKALGNPSNKTQQDMHENLQNVCAVNQCGDVTLTVLQTLGDEYNINILLEVQFPDSVDIEYHMTPVYDSSVPMGQNNIYPADYALCYGSIDYADVKKLNLGDTTDIYESGLDLISFSGGSSFSICDYSAQNHTITYLLEYFAGDNVFSGEISLVISGFASYSGEQISGPCVITWDAENNGSVLEYDIYEDGKDVGDLLISAFAADIDVYTHQDPEAIICTIAFADGTETTVFDVPITGNKISGDYRQYSVHSQYRQMLIPISDIESITLKGFSLVAK